MRCWVSHTYSVFADVVSSTALYDTLGDVEAKQKVQACLDQIAGTVESAEGQVIKSLGDGILATFACEQNAAVAALAMSEQTSDGPLSIRVGIHCGEVVEENGDVFGDVVNVAARIAGIAKTDEISKEAAQIDWNDGRSAVPKIDQLDKLRTHLELLDQWRVEGAPIGMRWGMYQGDTLFEPALDQYIASLKWGFVEPVKAQLESELGFSLFDRRNRRLLITPEGRHFHGTGQTRSQVTLEFCNELRRYAAGFDQDAPGEAYSGLA